MSVRRDSGQGGPRAADPRNPEALIVLDERETVIEWNNAATLILGYAREEAVGRDLGPMIVTADRLDEHRRRFAGLFEPQGRGLLGEPYESKVTRAGGEWIDVLVRITRMATEPPHFTVSIRELAPDPADELGLRLMRTVLESSEDPTAALTRDGIVTEWNPAAAELYGVSAEEALGRRLATLILPEELARVRMVPVHDSAQRIVGSVMIAPDAARRRRPGGHERRNAEAEMWGRRIDRAIEEDGFRLAAQPIFDLRSGKVHHHELLLRMRLEDRFALPEEFIAYAEESGQITEIDLLVARRGLDLASRFPVAINISAASLEGEELLGLLLEGLEAGSIPPGNLTVEITESAAADDLGKAVDFAELVVDMGCVVALDDFGTGYGTFTYLNKLPASELKIDRSFVGSLVTSDADRRIVETILEIAANFGMRTVAEGVEDEAVRSYLLSAGADRAQGYLLGRPAILGSERAEPLGL